MTLASQIVFLVKSVYAEFLTPPLRLRIVYTSDLIYKTLAGDSPYEEISTRATFQAEGTEWTVVGAQSPIVNTYDRPQTWPFRVIRLRRS